jgi:hypothetical protein
VYRIRSVGLGNVFSLTPDWSVPPETRDAGLGAWEVDVGGKVHRVAADTEADALRILVRQGVDVRRIRSSRRV